MLKREPREKKDLPKKGVRFKKDCSFCKDNLDIDYKNLELLSRYVSSRGKILSRRISGNCAKHQRKIARQVKLARFLNLLPYSGKTFS
ncbi:MAG: 30S ribosomal protein S18 [Candidatus Omnitrophica bacterium]|nr:30S ribosomal protein S18 [Candidatus Omnitrophota bacterium]MBU2043972.1 30S ribosomal protein S18 [Candidatus Omnitrophota bacterium]MBU2250792.1 30S ribosomal protein S18 [Candidatus Omnitrophota bacterium]MBU2266103.1 30S ribosomal protein S18 [Candidatus Omnitrophota bacterium]